jgi:hypothetical protein
MRNRPLSRAAAVVVAVAMTVLAACSSGNQGDPPSDSALKTTFCAALIAFRTSNDALSSDISSATPDTTKASVTRLVAQAKELQRRAPKDIADDVATVSTFIGKLDELFSKYDYDLTKLSADPGAAEQYTTLNSEDVQSALTNLRAYGDVDCAPPSAVPTSTSTTAPR